MSKEAYLLDTNVIIYALDGTSPFFPKAKAVLTRCFSGEIEGFVAQQNLLEATNVLVSVYKLPKKEVIKELHRLGKEFRLTTIFPLHSTIFTFWKLLAENKKTRADIFDFYLAATMVDNGLNQILTRNAKDFAGITTIKTLNPFQNLK